LLNNRIISFKTNYIQTKVQLKMDNIETIQEQHSAGPIAIGFDYQFYLFMYLLLELTQGQEIGFEVKDDIHIDKADGTTVQFQAKHTVLKNAKGKFKNLTNLDSDLWKSLSNWTEFINADPEILDYISNNSFTLITNKGENNNLFLNALKIFKLDKDIDKVIIILDNLKQETTNDEIKGYVKNILKLGKKKLKTFLSNLQIETNTDDIINKIKVRILEKVNQQKFVDPIYDALYSNLQIDKYSKIEAGEKFVVTFDEYISKYGRCFQIAWVEKPLPKRNFPVLLNDDLESQIFIKQLLDIGEIQSGSKHIRNYTTQMLKALNNFSYWVDEHFVSPTELDNFRENSKLIWDNEFKATYRQIERRLNAGESFESLEDDIKDLGIRLVEYLRRQDLIIDGFPSLGIELSNGHYYALSDELKIGWHYDWENKYTTSK